MKPVLQSLLLADHVYTDAQTGKKIVAGIFHTLFFRPFQNPVEGEPMQAPPPGSIFAGSPTAYISLTEVHEATTLDLRFVDLDDNSILFGANITIQTLEYDPLKTVELIVALPALPIQHKGHFALELLCGGELLGAQRVQAVELPEVQE